MSGVVLRDYQEAIIVGCRTHFRGGKDSVLIQLPTGGGKTLTSAFMVKRSAERGLTCWWLVHRREIIAQASRTFYELGIEHGTIAAGRSTDVGCRVQVGSIQTVARRLDKLIAPDMIFFDEAHHMASGQYQAVFNAYPNARKVGMTATPWRLDGRGLGHWFEAMVEGPSVDTLIERGSLSGYRLFAPSAPDVSAVGTTAGDFKKDALAKIMDKPAIVGDTIGHYRKLAAGKRAVAFCVSLEHSRHVVEQFKAADIPAEHIDGTMDALERDAIVGRFTRGETLIISNVEILGEGFDVPAIEAAILLRPTQSLSLHLQQMGRALRPCAGKTEAIILDHAGNCARHGLPDDERDWTLEDREKKRKGAKSEVMVKTCSKCFRVYRPAPACPGCGHAPAAVGREVETVEGELVEVDRASVVAKRKTLMRTANSLEDMKRIAAELGYKSGWAFHAWQNSRRNPARAGAR